MAEWYETTSLDSLATQISLYGESLDVTKNDEHEFLTLALQNIVRARSLAGLAKWLEEGFSSLKDHQFLVFRSKEAYSIETRELLQNLNETDFYSAEIDQEHSERELLKTTCQAHPPQVMFNAFPEENEMFRIGKIQKLHDSLDLLDEHEDIEQFRMIKVMLHKCITTLAVNLMRISRKELPDQVEGCTCCCLGAFSDSDYLSALKNM